MKPEFRLGKKNHSWAINVYYTANEEDALWAGLEMTFSENEYQQMSAWCDRAFRTWLTPRRARRMAFDEFHFGSKRDADWFVLFWSAVDFE